MDLVTLATKTTHNDKTFHQQISWSFANNDRSITLTIFCQLIDIEWVKLILSLHFLPFISSCFTSVSCSCIVVVLFDCGIFQGERTSPANHWPFMMKSSTLCTSLISSKLFYVLSIDQGLVNYAITFSLFLSHFWLPNKEKIHLSRLTSSCPKIRRAHSAVSLLVPWLSLAIQPVRNQIMWQNLDQTIPNMTNFSKVENGIDDVIITVERNPFLILIQHYNHLRSWNPQHGVCHCATSKYGVENLRSISVDQN